jgi:hypothetical protein
MSLQKLIMGLVVAGEAMIGLELAIDAVVGEVVEVGQEAYCPQYCIIIIWFLNRCYL